MSFRPRFARFAVVFLSSALGCAVDNSALLDGGAELPPYDGGALDIVRPPPFTGMCAGDASPLPDGACPGGASSDGGMITGDAPPPPPPPPPPPEPPSPLDKHFVTAHWTPLQQASSL